MDNSTPDARWFAVWTRSRQEKAAAAMLQMLGVQSFLPLKSELRQWSDRKQAVSVPLFGGYLFVRMNPTKDSRLQVLKTHGIAGFVGNGTGPVPIPDQQIDDIRTVVARQIECTVIPILEEGDRVRVVRGPLVGVEGRLLQSNSMSRLLISIEMIQKSLTVSLSREDVELLDRSADRPVDKNPCWITPNQNSGMPTRLAHRVTELEVSCQDNSQNLPIK